MKPEIEFRLNKSGGTPGRQAKVSAIDPATVNSTKTADEAGARSALSPQSAEPSRIPISKEFKTDEKRRAQVKAAVARFRAKPKITPAQPVISNQTV